MLFELPVKAGGEAAATPGDISEEYVNSSIIKNKQEEFLSPVLERQDTILKECEEYIRESRRRQDIATLKATGQSCSGCINSLGLIKKSSQDKKSIH